jgi:hypothetical protein
MYMSQDAVTKLKGADGRPIVGSCEYSQLTA